MKSSTIPAWFGYYVTVTYTDSLPADIDHEARFLDHLGRQAGAPGPCFDAGLDMNGKNRVDIKIGARVRIIQKQNQRSGKLTEGIVRDILTSSSTHPHGIKVRLTDGAVGRVQELMPES